MFPRRISLLEDRMSCRFVSQACPNVTLEDVAVLGECRPSNYYVSIVYLTNLYTTAHTIQYSSRPVSIKKLQTRESEIVGNISILSALASQWQGSLI